MPGAAPVREQLERLLEGQSSRDSHAVMNCACPCAGCKIYICATESQCLGTAALSVWLHWCFDIPGTFKIPLNATHRHQRTQRKDIEGKSKGACLEQSSCPVLSILKGSGYPGDRWSSQCSHKLISFASCCVNTSWQVQTIWTKKQVAKGRWGPESLARFP